jgi:general stress protein 26
MHENDPTKVWDIAKKTGVSMFVTRKDDGLDSRPLQAYVDQDAGMFFYMTDSGPLLAQTEADPRVQINFADKGANNYASIEGRAKVTNDRAKIKELWTVWAEAFWDGPDDPRIRVIEVTPAHARYWDGPNAVVTSIAILAGAVTGRQPKLGDAGDVQL